MSATTKVLSNSVTSIEFYVNGKLHQVKNPLPEISILSYLRSNGYTGPKLGCGEGGCGACTVMLQHWDKTSNSIVNRAVNGCLTPLCAVDGMAIITVEGIGNSKTGFHPIQERMAKFHGSQCGFCTPGIVMALYALLRNNPNATEKEIEEGLDGNLCRCTGYRPILDAAKGFASDRPDSIRLCPGSGLPCGCSGGKAEDSIASLSEETAPSKPQGGCCGGAGAGGCCKRSEDAETSSPTQPLSVDLPFGAQPIFPPKLRNYELQALEIPGEFATWYRPVSLEQLRLLKGTFRNNMKMVIGNTELGVEVRARGISGAYKAMVSTAQIPELIQIEEGESGLTIGASVTLTGLNKFIKDFIQREPSKGSTFHAFNQQLRYFASNQIRNVAGVAGNICTASPISDLNPVLIALGAICNVIDSAGHRRQIPICDFMPEYRTTALKDDEILETVFVPFAKELEFAHGYKQARRREDDIAIATAGFKVSFERKQESGALVVKDAVLCYGGLWRTAIQAKNLQTFLIGKEWTRAILDEALDSLVADVPLSQGAPGGQVEYRQSLAGSFFFKFFLYVLNELHHIGATQEALQPDELLVVDPPERPVTRGTQEFEIVQKGTSVGLPEPHTTAHLQVSGEAKYTDDTPKAVGELRAAFVGLNKPHARILSVDPSDALQVPGVVAYIDANDIPGKNDCSIAYLQDEPVFATTEVQFAFQPIGLIVAESDMIARQASRLVKIQYEELPAILNIQDAIEAQSFMGPLHSLKQGEPSAHWDECDVIVEGDLNIGGQEHFYLEPHITLAVPGEEDEITIVSSTQNATKTQKICAKVLNVPENRVVCKAKRLGGGFGGKETRNIFVSAAAAVAARKLQRPVRVLLERDVDMSTTGQRHPFHAKYKVGAKKDGTLVAYEADFYSNAGYSLDLSIGVMDRALFHADCCYRFPNMKVTGYICKTNLPSNTAFRGFGGPQGMIITEMIMEKLAAALEMKPHDLRFKNLYSANERTHFGQELENWHVPRLCDELLQKSDFERRWAEVQEFNAKNRYRKRGICFMPTKFGISFTVTFLNQGGALVHIYTDGSVLVTHGGVEMGQGLNIKCAQIAATTLNVPLKKVFISETSTDKVPNTSPTAASMGSDLFGMAVLEACKKLRQRLDKVAQTMKPDASWEQLVNQAYMERTNLSATGFHKVPDIYFDFDEGTGRPFSYFTEGAACSEVEIDVLTGDLTTRQVDICMDVGESLNPAIDIGQIEGAFVQGMGLFMMEQMIWGDKDHPWVPPGLLFTRGPGAYKIPSFDDVPIDMRVHLLGQAPNPCAVYSSKAIGEPPLFLSSTVYFAMKEAVASARRDAGLSGYVAMDTPATPERIRMGCADHITKRFIQEEEKHQNYKAKGSF